MDDLTELEDASIFRLDAEPIRSYEKDFDVQIDIQVEMNLN